MRLSKITKIRLDVGEILFIEMEDPENVEVMVKTLEGTTLGGRTLVYPKGFISKIEAVKSDRGN